MAGSEPMVINCVLIHHHLTSDPYRWLLTSTFVEGDCTHFRTNQYPFASTTGSSNLGDDLSPGLTTSDTVRSMLLPEGCCEKRGQILSFCPVPAAIADRCSTRIGPVVIDMLPDDVLLEIFYICTDRFGRYLASIDSMQKWRMLTQVCRRWRHLVFGSPLRLNLRVVCTSTTPTRRSLDIWPPFPITVLLSPSFPAVDENGVENIIAALERRGRVSQIYIPDINGPALQKLTAVMQEPFPTLTFFYLGSKDGSVTVIPEAFLGGSAPCLRRLVLYGIPFPSLPKFLSCVTQIIELHLIDMPNSGYISPEMMTTCLAMLPNLENFSLGFLSPFSRPDQISPPLQTLTVLPALTDLSFRGTCEYFEDLTTRIDATLLSKLTVAFLVDFDVVIPRLHYFVNRAERLGPFKHASILLNGWMIKIVFGSPTRFELNIRCETPDRQLSLITQVFSQQLPLLSHVEWLWIHGLPFPWGCVEWQFGSGMDASHWLGVFHLLTSLQSLYVSKRLVPHVAAALQELTEGRVMEVLPVLDNLFLEGFQPGS